jgi:F-type H+-transporting ATPase subunit delta
MATADKIHETVLDSGVRQSRLARVYAEALLQAALKVSPQAPLQLGEEMLQLRSTLIEHPEVAEFLASPALGKKGKLEFLEKAMKEHASEPLRGLIHALWQNNRLSIFRNVVAAYLQILNDRAGRVLVTVTSAVSLTDKQKDNLTATLKDVLRAEPVLNVHVDRELIGGMIIKAGDTVIDTSVRSRLQAIRTQLLAQ